MTYDVPVKLFSFHLDPDVARSARAGIPRLLRVLVFNRRRRLHRCSRRSAAGAAAIQVAHRVQILFGGFLLWDAYSGARQSWATFGGGAPKSPLYGIWVIERMTIDGIERAPLVTDYERWRRVVFQSADGVTFRRMDDTFVRRAGARSTWRRRRSR